MLAVTAAALAAVTARAADKYPSHPIRVMVPFGAGSATDIVIRIVGEQFRQITGQAFVVENKPGVNGLLAIEEMLKAPADGYTLEVGNAGTNVLSPIIYKSKFKFDYGNEVTVVTRLGEVPLILAATTKDFEPKTYAELIAYAKAHPGDVRYASVGAGSNNHYDTEAFAQWAGIKLYHVPNKGGGGAITNDVVRGDVHIVLVNAASSARSGQGRIDPRAGGDGRSAAAGLSRRADPEGAWLCRGRRALVCALRAGPYPARCARDAAPGHCGGAEDRGGPDHVRQADDQGRPRRDAGRCPGVGQARNRALEGPDRAGENRTPAVTPGQDPIAARQARRKCARTIGWISTTPSAPGCASC